ncbi:sugar ABC transporter permease [Myceligenerans sp. TRM 65318]|uniref:Sugar ABC transporter permease n=2 Tax=Myceligenerans pegani TaxID=2776917 RepID=A0ABR9MZ18_9MICO|nr:sugar ABC transporter permease [Myceligenerans sp. TRM 65318]MBE3018921.1 sugar ABC transporter permease [Myceligenerans sp. TRM 65318]
MRGAPPRRGGSTRRGRGGKPGGWAYLTPLLAALGVWIYGPALITLVLSFTEWSLTDTPTWAGPDNFRTLLADGDFLRSAGQTVLYALALLPFATFVPLVVATMLWMRPGRAAVAYRSLLFLPVMVAPVSVAVAWRFLLDPLNGLLAIGLRAVGLPPVDLLGDPSTALVTIVLVTAARVTAFNMLLYGAALSGLDRRLLEAARLERATAWETLRFVVLPQLVRPTVVLALLSLVLAGQWTFTNVAVLTQGGPDNATDSVYYRIYTLGFGFFQIGPASAAAMLVLAALAVVGTAAVLARRGRRYE